MSEPHHSANDRRVSIARLAQPTYEDANTSRESAVATAIAEVAGQLDWTTAERGPFGGVIPDGARVLVKPNWVLHANQGPWGMEPLVTHPSVIKATVSPRPAPTTAEVTPSISRMPGPPFGPS